MIRWLMFFLMFSSAALCQQVVEGTIVDDETSEPVPFASISIVGTSKGTSSNLNGQFSLSVTEPISLMITCVGYETYRIKSLAELKEIRLRPVATLLDAIVVSNRPIDAKRIIKKAFANIPKNYSVVPFMQNFFYRHYCKDDSVYGRLIEASVDIWKNRGYRSPQQFAGQNDEIRITQLRRSLDKTEIAQGHEPISVGNILETDLVGYQATLKSDHYSIYANVSNLKIDLDSYSFKFKGITLYDNHEVYQIDYTYKKDSVITPSGNYRIRTIASGSLFITTGNYAFVKTEELKTDGRNTIRTLAYYRKYADQYYPYHFILEGVNKAIDNSSHSTHIELMSVEIKTNAAEKFTGRIPGQDQLLNIPYDSVFWTSSTILKTTPLEDDIIRDLGGGASLMKQFTRYRQYELSTRNGGKDGEEKFNWFSKDSKGNRILYLIFWSGDFKSNLTEFELAKRLNKQYRDKITFVFISLDDDEKRWQQMVQQFNTSSDGIINYRIGSNSSLANTFKVNKIPTYILIAKNGDVFDLHAKHPSDLLLENDFKFLMEQH